MVCILRPPCRDQGNRTRERQQKTLVGLGESFLPAAPGMGLAFLFFRDNAQYTDQVRSLYPGGTPGEVRADDGTVYFTTYVLTPEQVGRR